MAPAGLTSAPPLRPDLEASEPPEARGLRRDQVRLMVSDVTGGAIHHARFHDLPRWLAAGDVLVVNTSATINASLPASGGDGMSLEVHLSTALPGGFWAVEVREAGAAASHPLRRPFAGTSLELPGGARVRLFAPYPVGGSVPTTSRLWLAALSIPMPLADYLARHGSPIRYRYVPERWPLEMYQTVFANEPGSAEMPSAGRPFSTELVTQLVSSGVRIAPILLHTGVASLEDHEPPYEEFYRVSRETADTVNLARRSGRRVVAVGTTAVRALETVADADGTVSPGEGWTTVVISPTRPTRCIDAVVTGLHEPQATHLLLLEQVVAAAQRRRPAPAHRRRDAGLLREAYDEAVERRYLWHEFGDSHLII